MSFQAEAEVRSLDHSEVSLVSHRRTPIPPATTPILAFGFSEVTA
jgi:hypothetical protein